MIYNESVRKATRTSGGKGNDKDNKLEGSQCFKAKTPKTVKAAPVAWTFSRNSK